MPIDKKPVLAYDREKRVYKDAYVTNFRQVRHFPALATIGAGKADGDSIILVQEGAHATPREGDAVETDAPSLRSRFKDVPSRLIPHDSLDAMFESTAPLSNFRNAVMCKHTNARLVNGSTPMSGCKNQSSCDSPGSRYGLSTSPPLFKVTSAADAKATMETPCTYDAQVFVDKTATFRPKSPRPGYPLWQNNNPANAKEDIRTKKYFNVPPGGVVVADRAYTRDFIRAHMEAYQAARTGARRGRSIDLVS